MHAPNAEGVIKIDFLKIAFSEFSSENFNLLSKLSGGNKNVFCKFLFYCILIESSRLPGIFFHFQEGTDVKMQPL